MFKNTHLWIPTYIRQQIKKILGRCETVLPTHIFLCVCDHFEPYWKNPEVRKASEKIMRWTEEYPKIASKYKDSDGKHLKWSFFYPQEEYKKVDMDELAKLCHSGFGEVEIHLHHDNDTPENLRRTLLNYKKCLRMDHGLLSVDRENGDLKYGFIHGNWALNNSRPDRRWCGVNDEISILLETGCYADFTMPSAPSNTQTKKINSIYYALGDNERPKSHDDGTNARMGSKEEGLLMVQGPLTLNWRKRIFGIFPSIENGGIQGNNGPRKDRIDLWVDERIHVSGNPSWVFIKLYTHGTQEDVMKMFFENGGLESLFSEFKSVSEERGINFHYVSSREMVNIITAVERGDVNYNPSLRDFPYQI